MHTPCHGGTKTVPAFFLVEKMPTHSRYFSDELVGSCAC